ncbi:MAG: hypothetical protein VX278_10240, partial [Myxococcota bacterium]|nr:hypothetical protein [Myxococcota bacterium]
KNQHYALFVAIVWIFLWYQIAGTILCFTNTLSVRSASFVLLLPIALALLGSDRSPAQKQQMPLLPFLPFLALYLLLATPDPWYRDSLTYHLALSRQYSLRGGFFQTDEIVFSYFPQGWQSILALFHTFGENGYVPFNPRYLGVILSMGTALGISGILKQYNCSSKWSITAGALFLLAPTALEFGASCYVQPWLVLLTLYTVYLATRDNHSGIWTGMLCGCLLSLKYSALFILVLLSPLYLYRRKPLFFLGALLFGTPYYLRNFLLKENPIFPLGYNLFQGSGWDHWRAMAYAITLDNYGMGKQFTDYLLLPFRVISTTDMIHHFQGSIGIGFGIAVGSLFYFRNKLSTHEKIFAYTGLGWSILWAFNVHQIRFLMPVLPLLLIASTRVVQDRFPTLWKAQLILGVLWIIYPAHTLFTKQHTTKYFRSPHTYLEQQLSESYPIYQYLNAIKTPKVWLIWMRGYHYYLDSEVRVDSVFGGYRMEILLNDHQPEEIQKILAQANIHHLVINWKFFLQGDNADRLGEGQTLILRRKFEALLHANVLTLDRQFGNVWVYTVGDGSSS